MRRHKNTHTHTHTVNRIILALCRGCFCLWRWSRRGTYTNMQLLLQVITGVSSRRGGWGVQRDGSFASIHRGGKLERDVFHPFLLVCKLFFVGLIKISKYFATNIICVLHRRLLYCNISGCKANAHAPSTFSSHCKMDSSQGPFTHILHLHSSIRSSLFSSFLPCFHQNASSCLLFLWHLTAHLSFLLFFHLFVQSRVSVKGAPRVGMAAWHGLTRLPMNPLGCPSRKIMKQFIHCTPFVLHLLELYQLISCVIDLCWISRSQHSRLDKSVAFNHISWGILENASLKFPTLLYLRKMVQFLFLLLQFCNCKGDFGVVVWRFLGFRKHLSLKMSRKHATSPAISLL